MDIRRPSWDHLDPFWRGPASQGRTVTVFDVPFAPLVKRPGCTEVLDWGPHDHLKGRLEVSPPSLERVVAEVGGVHPFADGPVDAAGPEDHAGLAHAVARCLTGVEQRGRVARWLLT